MMLSVKISPTPDEVDLTFSPGEEQRAKTATLSIQGSGSGYPTEIEFFIL